MNYVLAVFRSRFATLNFANMLSSYNIPVAIINTPQEISRTCGISVKFLSDFFSNVQSIMKNRGGFNGFVGFFAYSNLNGKINIVRL